MLSSLPKLADRSFIIGFFLPSLLFSCCALWILSEHSRVDHLLESLVQKEIGSAVFVLLGVWVLGVMLLTMNYSLYRLFEGYIGPSWLLNRGKERYRQRLATELAALEDLYKRWQAEGDDFGPVGMLELQKKLRNRLAKFPETNTEVLPTAFGNSIKAFEVYAREVYGADGVSVWLRLQSVIPKQFQDSVQDVRSQIDFLVNGVVLAGLLIVLLIADSVLWRLPWQAFPACNISADATFLWSHLSIPRALGMVGLFILCWALYEGAVRRVPAWGELVMTAFDCYLPALAKQLGFQLPQDDGQRREFWTTFSQMILYRRGPDGTLPFDFSRWPPAQRAEGQSPENGGEREEKGGG